VTHRKGAVAATALAVALVAVGVIWSRRGVESATRATTTLHVPRATSDVKLDGETGEVAWRAAARTGPFTTSDGVMARPHAEARLVWSGQILYLSLYAADRDIRSQGGGTDGPAWLADHFHLVFTLENGDERVIDLSPSGDITDGKRPRGSAAVDYRWGSDTKVATDADGTINDSSDEDEEWSLEVAIPLSSLQLRGRPSESIGFSVRHCDVPPKGPRACGSFGEGPVGVRLVLD